MFVTVITCAHLVSCGLDKEIRSKGTQPTREECVMVGELAIELAHLDKRQFVIRCDPVKQS